MLKQGTVAPLTRRSFSVAFDSTKYDEQLEDIRKKCLFRDAFPPEFRDYYDPGGAHN